MDANVCAASLPQAEELSLALENTTSLKRTNQHLEDNVARDEYLGFDESMDTTTVNEQGAQWDFTNVVMGNQACRKIVAEKPFLFLGAHPCANRRSKSNVSWSRMTQREK